MVIVGGKSRFSGAEQQQADRVSAGLGAVARSCSPAAANERTINKRRDRASRQATTKEGSLEP